VRFPPAVRHLGRVVLAGAILSSVGERLLGGETRKDRHPDAPPSRIEHVSSELVLIETYVTDGNGRPVPGLTAGDFVLEVDGHRRPIASVEFREVAPDPLLTGSSPSTGTPSGTTWPRRFALFFEDGTSSPLGLTAARKAVNQFLVSGLAPSDQVALVAYDKRLRILRDFTTDREALRGDIAESLKDSIRYSDFADEESEHWREFGSSPNWASAVGLCQAEVARLGGVVKALGTLVASLARWHGYKAVIFMGDGIPEAPG